MSNSLPPDYWKKKLEEKNRTDPQENKKRYNDDCHCHNECLKCKESPSPTITCIHCKPEEFQQDDLTPLRKDLSALIESDFMHGERCGSNYYGHKGWYCGCGKEQAIKEEIKELITLMRKYKKLL